MFYTVPRVPDTWPYLTTTKVEKVVGKLVQMVPVACSFPFLFESNYYSGCIWRNEDDYPWCYDSSNVKRECDTNRKNYGILNNLHFEIFNVVL